MNFKWEAINKLKVESGKLKVKDIVNLLLENRGLKTARQKEDFLNPDISKINSKTLKISSVGLTKSIARIKKAIKEKEQIIIFGDYDVDGVCASAILWETLNEIGAKVMPFIPGREEEGYGLSKKGILSVLKKFKNTKLMITVDNGIVANKGVDFANKNGIDVIITDHHIPSSKLPNAYSIVHTTEVCGAGVAWALAQELKVKSEKLKVEDNHLELVAIASIADMVPLKGANRSLVKFGLESLRKTKRIGLLEIFKEARIERENLQSYQISYVVAPRINAMGRLELAMDSLRLICTRDKKRAVALALKLGNTNRKRQNLTEELIVHAKREVAKKKIGKLIFIGNKDYQQGVIGLVAGKLVEQYYRPSIVYWKGDEFSKASARSIKDFNIIEFIRRASDCLVDFGGHPMAAGFTFETKKAEVIKKKMEEIADKLLNSASFIKTLKYDLEIPLSALSIKLYESIAKMEPFGIGNPVPVFASKAIIEDIRFVGKENSHLKLKLRQLTASNHQLALFDAIGFGIGEEYKDLKVGKEINIACSIDENEWNGNKRLQLKIRDMRLSSSDVFLGCSLSSEQ
ncbi:single-stranded-DNA-specific exonuclease RecJ [Patescibacteria group bacterium]|nr:single-stranded-DNA-specific exonuclease RecJ [Patescibacteria group bacterium]